MSHASVGEIIDPAAYNSMASRISLCAGTSVGILILDTTGTPSVTVLTPGMTCSSATECIVKSLTAKVQYIAVSSDGTDTDRMTLIPR